MQNQPSNSLVNLLVSIITHLLRNNLIHSALFFAERLHTLIPSAELATYLLAVCLLKLNDYQATVHLLRNAPVFIPSPSSAAATVTPLNNRKGKQPDPFNDSPCNNKLNPNQRPANLASTRCALVYSKACSMIDRPKEGLEVYLEAIDHFGISSHDQDFLLASTSEQSTSSAYTHLANLAYNSHEYEKASQFYSKALESTPDGHLCWEAFEGLCQTISTEHDLDPNQIFSVTQLEHFLPGYMELDDQFVLCTSSTNPSTTNHIRHPTSSHPIVSNAPIKPKPPPLAPKDAFRIMGANGLYRHKQMLIDTSFGDSSRNSSFAFNSFDLPSYHPKAGQIQPNSNFISHATPSTPNLNRPSPLPPRSFHFVALGEPPQHASSSAYDPIPISSTPNLRHGFEHNPSSSSNHPPPMPAPSPLPYYPKKSSCDHQSPLPAKGQQARGGLISVKRTRSQTQSQDLSRSSTGPPTTTPTELDSGHSTNTDMNSNANSQPTATATATTTTTTAAATTTQTAKLGDGRLLSRREILESGRLLKVGPRETKRAKSNSNMMDPDQHPSTPTLPSDPPPTSYPPQSSSSVPLPSSSSSSNFSRFRADKIQAIKWVLDLLRVFAAAQLALSRFKSDLVLDLLASLPADQQRSWRVYCLIGRARFEMLDYKSAEIAFRKARECFPHLVTHMDIYSTLLWHLRKTTMLSYLSQELQLINSQASETWIATGNLFSRLDDHPNALKCFQRATQLCKTSSYGYTLSGHESLMLAEYSRSLVFFRESIRRNSRSNYNAFFGLGECFFKQDRFRLALFFFNHARKINPYNPLILSAVAKVYQAVGDLQPALEVFSQAVNLAHNCVASVRFSRAKILFELGEFEESKEDLLKLVELVPTEFNVRFLLGKIFAKLGNRQLAIKHLTFAVDLDPKSLAVVKKILDHLHHSNLDQQNHQAGSEAS